MSEIEILQQLAGALTQRLTIQFALPNMTLNSMQRFAAFLITVALFGCHSATQQRYSDKPELSPLMNAAAHNDLDRIRRLLAQGADVKQRTRQGETALYEAIDRHPLSKDNLPTVDALLKAGADPNEIEIFGLNALEVSLTRDYGNPEVTLLLLRSGASVPSTCGQEYPLVTAATQGSNLEVMRALIASKAPVNCQDANGMTALHWAALNGQADRVELLLQNGADPNLRNNAGWTPLNYAMNPSPSLAAREDFKNTRVLLQGAMSRATER